MKHSGKRAAAFLAAASLLWGATADAYAANEKTVYGILAFAAEQYSLTNHLVSFPLNGEGNPVYTSAIGFSQTSTAGAYADEGNYYVAATKTEGSKEVPDVLVRMNLDSGISSTVGTMSGFDWFVNDMTFDHSTSTMYAVAKVDETCSALYTVDLQSGKGLKVADLDRKFFTLACTWAGQLYAISFTGDLCKINKNDGTVSVVGHTGFYPEKFQSMEFDHGTKELWWAATTHRVNESGTIELQETYMANVDISTGVATRGRALGDDQITGIYIPYVVVPDGAPQAVDNLDVVPAENGEYAAVLSWTNPTHTFGGEPVKTFTGVRIFRDGNPVGEAVSPEPGKESRYTDAVGSSGGGHHVWSVVASTAAGDGVPATVESFIGTDVPGKVTGITIERLGTNSARLSWGDVTTGANGGWIDRTTLKYNIIRYPDETTVAEGLVATEWVESGVSTAGNYKYAVIAENATGTSEPSFSEDITLGPNLGFPYADSFSEEEFAKWTVFDANEDGNTWQFYNLSWAKAAGAYFMSANHAGDDWLVSHAFEFEGNSTYKVMVSCLANGNHNIDFVLLKDYDLSAPVKNLGTLSLSSAWALDKKEFVFGTDEAGVFNFAIHQTTEQGNSYMIIDEIQIEKLVDNNLAATEINGNTRPVLGNTYPYAVTVLNRGKKDRSDFAVELIDGNDRVVGSTVVAALASGQTMPIYVPFAAVEGVTSLRGRIADPLDEIASDNVTQALEITVMPLGTPEEVTVGTKNRYGSNSPFYFASTYSVSQQVYSANEIGISRGRITAVKYDYKTSTWSEPPTAADIKVYLANTELATATDGWIPMEELSLVYEGTIDMERGEGSMNLELTKAFDYEGGNLAVVTMHSLENSPQTYYYSVQFPYYESPLENNVPLYYNSREPIVYGEAQGSKNTYNGNTSVTFMMQTGGATLSGVVKDDNQQPVTDATVTIEPLHATAETAEDGSYKFDFVPNGTYTVSVSKTGYESVSRSDISVSDADVEINISMAKLPAYSVCGKVVSPEGEPVEGATVRLTGYIGSETVSAADGSFEFENVVAQPSSLTVTKDWYAPASLEFDFNQDHNTGDIKLGYAHYTVGNVEVLEQGDGNPGIVWTAPDEKNMLRFDSGVQASQIGIGNTVGTSVIGTAFRPAMLIDCFRWQTTAEGGPHNTVNLYVYALGPDGEPTGSVIYSCNNISNKDGEWTEHIPEKPVEAPNGCLVSLNYPGFIGLAIDNGRDEYPFAKGTYYYSLDFTSGEFDDFEKLGLDGNLMIRVGGYAFPEENEPQAVVGEGREPLPSWYAYNVWRGYGAEPSEWTLLTDTPVGAGEFSDTSWDALAPGVYRYAVAPVYPDGTVSERVYSACVLNNVYSTLKVRASTNSHSTDASGAKVKLYDTDHVNVYDGIVDGEGIAEIDGIWKNRYTLEISHPGYETLETELDITTEDEIETALLILKEIIAEPVNLKLYAETDGGDIILTWNESGEIADDFESYNPFGLPAGEEMVWKCVDADGGRTFAEQEFNFPGRTEPMSFIVFNPKKTSPSMFDSRSASHSHSGDQHLACFASIYGNDDYLISPRLTYHTPFKFGFWAKGYSQTYGETIEIGYSSSTDAVEAFTWTSGMIDVPKQQWQHYEFEIPADARYVAIHSTSADGFTLFVDDITISSGNGFDMNVAVSGPEVSYEVMLDGESVATTEEPCCNLGTSGDGVHTAAVRAVYASGCSSFATVTFGTDGIVVPDADGEIRVWPNPAIGYTNISGEFEEAGLYDLSGRLVARFGNESRQIDLSGVIPGFYILDVRTAHGSRSFRIVVK